MNKSPSFRFYPADFMGSPAVQAMDLHEVGAYMFLLCTAWQSARYGFLPDNDEKLRRWARMSREQWAESGPALLEKFPIVEEGWRANPRLVQEAEKQQAYSQSQAAKGRMGGRPYGPVLSGKKLELYAGFRPDKPKASVGASPEKPSASVFVSEDLKLSSSENDLPRTASGGNINDEAEAVKEVFAYYLDRIGRSSVYTLTDLRLRRGAARLRELLRKGGDLRAAVESMKLGVDGLAKEDWNMGRDPKTNGKRYVEWETNLMGEEGKLQTWIEAGRGSGSGTNSAPQGTRVHAPMPAPLSTAQKARLQQNRSAF